MDNVSLGMRLKLLRGKQTQAAFAEIIGVNVNTLRGYEGGNRLPTADTIFNICTKTNVSTEWLIMGIGPMFLDATFSPSAAPDGENGRRVAHLESQHAEIVGSGKKNERHVAHFEGASISMQPSEAPDVENGRHVSHQKKQCAENIELGGGVAADVSALLKAKEENAELHTELRDLLRQNGDLRVENAELRARVRDLERELREALKKDERQTPVAGAG